MPDFVAVYAQAMPERVAVVDDRPDGSVLTRTWSELNEQTNRLADVLIRHGAGPGTKVVWCGPNSIGVVLLVSAARKIGTVAVPLNYRLADDEAAYVVDHCDATVAYVDAESAPMFAPPPGAHPPGWDHPRL